MPEQTPKGTIAAKKTRGPRKAPNPQSLLVPARHGVVETGIPYTSLRDAVFRGELAVVKIGRGWYFERAELRRFIASKTERVGA